MKFNPLRICGIYNINNLFTQAPAEDVKIITILNLFGELLRFFLFHYKCNSKHLQKMSIYYQLLPGFGRLGLPRAFIGSYKFYISFHYVCLTFICLF